MAGFPRAGDEYAGRYRIVRELGHGGMGIVYEAVDGVLNRSVALKIVLPSLPDRDDYQTRFGHEASALAKIRSRHIVGIHEYGKHEDTVYFVTELFPDGDLQGWLKTHGPLDRRDALLLVAQVCEALADAHAAGVVHRDVKPGNVLLWNRAEGLIPYLCDFGIAVDGEHGLTRTGALVGSPAYMAPERHFGHPADERGDVYSVGCLLWAVLTGDAPHSGTDFQMMNSHINEPTPQLGTGDPVDKLIDQLLLDALHKDPEQRLSTADELRQRLLAIVRGVDAPPAARSDEVPAEDPRRRLRWSAAAVALLLLGGVATAVAINGDDEPLPNPDPPRVSAASGYRSVAFTVAAPRYGEDAEVSVQYDGGAGWETARRTVKVDTLRGGAERCVRFRSVATSTEGTTATSRAVRECGTARRPTVEFIRSDDPCVNSRGGSCTWYDVRVSGFPSFVTPLVNVRRTTGEPWCDACEFDRIRVGGDGRGYLRHDWKVSRDEGRVVLEVDGVTREFHVFH